MIVLVCGGRRYFDEEHMEKILDKLFEDYPEACIVQGGAPGADNLAKIYCKKRGKPCLTMEAPWDFYKSYGGSIRNEWMLKYCDVQMVLHFPGGPGTANMVNQAQIRKIPTYAC